jgi:hypothetical protein
MCGRARLSSDVSEIKLLFGIPPERPTPNIGAKLEPGADRSGPGRALHYDAKDGGRFTPHDAEQVEIVLHTRQRHIRDLTVLSDSNSKYFGVDINCDIGHSLARFVPIDTIKHYSAMHWSIMYY